MYSRVLLASHGTEQFSDPYRHAGSTDVITEHFNLCVVFRARCDLFVQEKTDKAVHPDSSLRF